MRVERAESGEACAKAKDVLVHLRPQLARLSAAEFEVCVKRMQAEGYRLVLGRDKAGAAVAAAGYRIFELFAHGRVLYVDDLVVDPGARSRGCGRAMLEWLADVAREEGCASLQLDSGTQRVEAHRFYLRERFSIRSFRFVRPL